MNEKCIKGIAEQIASLSPGDSPTLFDDAMRAHIEIEYAENVEANREALARGLVEVPLIDEWDPSTSMRKASIGMSHTLFGSIQELGCVDCGSHTPGCCDACAYN